MLFLDSFDDVAPGEPYTLINPSQGMIEVINDTIMDQSKSMHLMTGNSVDQILDELKSVNASLPSKKTNIDQALIDKVRNKAD